MDARRPEEAACIARMDHSLATEPNDRRNEMISLVDRRGGIIEETSGRFEERDQVCKELWPLPDIDGLNVQVCTFSAAGACAGSCVRADRSLVNNMESDCLPLRVVSDNAVTSRSTDAVRAETTRRRVSFSVARQSGRGL